MKKLFTLLASLLITVTTFAQGVLTGTITDADTKQPLEGASVFAQNTTIGTITKKDGTYRLSLLKGGYELVVSFTGYAAQRINIEANGEKTIDLALKKEDKSLSEVVIMSNNEVTDGWEKYGTFFLDHFLGKTDNAKQTTLENPQALKFFYYKRSDKLKIFATEPLKVANKALGYNLQYNLDSFVYYYKTDLNSYRGNCLFLPMEGDAPQQAKWASARRKAYNGSRLHFMRAYYDSSLKEEGFMVDMLSETSKTDFEKITNLYDTTYYVNNDSLGNVEVYFPRKISISYKVKPDASYLQQMNLSPRNTPMQVTYVDLLDGIIIKPNGYFTEQGSWVNQGYWSWKNVADQLPYDYDPSAK